MPSQFDADAYWAMTAVINLEYAKKFEYSFRWIEPTIDKSALSFNVNWLKLLYLKHRLAELSTSSACSWVLYLDTDAIVRESDLPLSDFLGDLSARYPSIKNTSAIFAQEDSIPAAFASGDASLFSFLENTRPRRKGFISPWHHVNAGVFFLKAGAQSEALVDAWLESGRHDQRARNRWPAEQGTLTELLFPGRYNTTLPPCPCHAEVAPHASLQGSFAVVNFTEMNGPWGRFVKHDWSGPGGERRVSDFEEELMRIGVADAGSFAASLREVGTCSLRWTPDDF